MRIFHFIITLVLLHAGLVRHAVADEPLTDVASIRSLTRDEAAGALPVKLTGVVIYKGWKNLVLHDGKASVFLDFSFAQSQGVWQGPLPNLEELDPGTHVEVEGVTDAGGFSPMVLVADIQRRGMRAIPAPMRPNLEKLLSSSLDTQWVEVEGVVRKFEDSPEGPQCLTLLVGGHSCPVLPRNRVGLSSNQLVDAKVRVRGVLLNIANLRAQTSGLKIHCNGMDDIDVIAPP
ncbi:hypothetical protein GW813_12740, partial [bacterium]|nr:hypothetical protein [bacterium]